MPGGAPVLFVGSGLVHPGPLLRSRVVRMVRAHRVSAGSVWLPDCPSALRSLHPACTVGYFHHRRDDRRVVDALSAWVEHGGAFVAVHGALASFKGNEDWERLVGVRFAGHAPVGELSIAPTPGAARMGVEIPRLTITDEQYRFSPVSDTTVLATSDSGGDPAPTFWYREHGEGRVICVALGHGHRAVRSPAFASVFSAALRICESAE